MLTNQASTKIVNNQAIKVNKQNYTVESINH